MSGLEEALAIRKKLQVRFTSEGKGEAERALAGCPQQNEEDRVDANNI